MAQVSLKIGGRTYDVACRDGEEARLIKLAEIVDEKAEKVRNAIGAAGEPRQLLLAAILLADELAEARVELSLKQGMGDALAETVETLATRIETIAESLEKSAESA